jgi:fructose-1,6-bisphosphatase II
MDDRNLALDLVRVTEAASIACARTMGQGDPERSDQHAVSAMRAAFEPIPIHGEVVIGEGERDEAPMLFIGEKVGRRQEGDPQMDIALDPLEGTALCAHGRPGAISVIAMAPEGHLLNAPDIYMSKIACGPVGRGVIDIDKSPTWNLERLAEAKGTNVSDLTAIILDRPRHEDLIEEVREAGARIKLISDGDVHAAIATADEDTGIDVLMGIGGAPEGVVAAAALRCVGGDMQGRLWPKDEAQEARVHKVMGEDADIDATLELHELAGEDLLFAATGVTDGELLDGVRYYADGCETHSIVMRSHSGTVRYIRAEHNFERKPHYTLEGLHKKMDNPNFELEQ